MTEHVHEQPEHLRSRDVAYHHRPVRVADPGHPFVSWGAIFAGLVVLLGLSWLLHLLGLAFGVSVSDAADTTEGLPTGAVIWMVLSWMIAFFVASLATARLAGFIDDVAGMLHGFVVWGLGTVAILIMGWMGVSSLLQTGQQVAATAAQGMVAAGSGAASAVGYTASGVASAAEMVSNQFGNQIQDRLADEAAEIAADSSAQLSAAEMRNVIYSLDERTMRRVVLDLTNNDREGAAQLMADTTELSLQDARALVNSAYSELEQQLGNPENEAPLTQDLQNQLASGIDGYVATLDARGGAQVTEQDVRRAVASLDADAVQGIASRLAAGDANGAKRILVQNTSLSTEQVNELYEGAMAGVEQEVQQYRQELNQAIEAVSTYTSQVLWVAFVGTALALLVSLGGGWLGADTTRRLHAG